MKKKKLKAIIKELERDIILMDNEHIKQYSALLERYEKSVPAFSAACLVAIDEELRVDLLQQNLSYCSNDKTVAY